jgi:flagellar biosynthetic protein FliR
MTELDISAAWAIGMALAVTRASAFVSLCAFVPRTIPALGRTALALAFGLLIAQPVGQVGSTAGELITAAFVNVVLGGVLGWFLGLAINLFQVAGSIVDTTSGVTLGAVFDPDSQTTPGPFSRFFTLGGQALVMALGGLTVMAQGLWLSTRVVALDGNLGNLRPLGPAATDSLSSFYLHGVELALPIASVLFVGELAFGLLSRMAPQINTFLIGLPLKTLVSLAMLSSAAVMFPRFADRALASGVDAVTQLLGSG